jgi:hypothetical protein
MDYQPKPEKDPRPSLTTSLEQRYKDSTSLSKSGNAKLAGKPGLAATDLSYTGDGEFRPLQGPAGIRNDTLSVQKRTWETHGGKAFLPTVKYAPSGRL